MQNFFRILYIVSGVLIAVSLLLYFFPPAEYLKPSPAFEQIDVTHEEHGFIYAIAIDMNGSNKVDKESLFSGDDSILIIKPEAVTQATVEELPSRYVFNTLASVLKYDDTKDGWLDISDKVYSSLELMTLTRTGNPHFMPLSQAGVQALAFDRKYGSANAEQEQLLNKTIGYAVLTDGGRRGIHVVRLPVSLLHGVTQ